MKGFRYATFSAFFDSIFRDHSYLIQLEDYNDFLAEVREIYSNQNQSERMLPASFKAISPSLKNGFSRGTSESRYDYRLTSLPDGLTPYYATEMDRNGADFSCRLSIPKAVITDITETGYRDFLHTNEDGSLCYVRYHEAQAQVTVPGELLVHNGKEYRSESSKEQVPCVFIRCAEIVGNDIHVSKIELEAATLYKPGMLRANHPEYFQ